MSRDEHRGQRPSWTCVADDLPWPCDLARKLLVAAYPDPATLTAILGRLMITAAEELHASEPTQLYQRFLAWTMARGECCRVCGRRNHAVVPGLPPRLFPCRAAFPADGLDRQPTPCDVGWPLAENIAVLTSLMPPGVVTIGNTAAPVRCPRSDR